MIQQWMGRNCERKCSWPN